MDSDSKVFIGTDVRFSLLNHTSSSYSSNSTLDMNYFKLFKNNQQVEILLPLEE